MTASSAPSIERRPLGIKCGINLTAVGTGLWAVPGSEWGPADDQTTLDAIEASLDAGVNFFDTADVYGGGRSEEILGKAMKGRRDRFIVATKVGWVGFDGDNGRSQYDTVDKVIAGVELGLKRLDTDYVDAIQCHVNFIEPNTPVMIEGFRKLKEMGKVRAWGVSTSDLDLIKAFNADGDCDLLQIDYSILNRTPEAEILPYCKQRGIGVIVRGPIAMGLLADKFSAASTFPDNDFRRNWINDPEQNAQFLKDLAAVEKLRAVVPAGQTMAQFALRFAMTHPAITTIIPGARNEKQALANTAVARFGNLTEQEQASVNAIVPPAGGRKIWPA